MMSLALVLINCIGAYLYHYERDYVRSALKSTAFALPATVAYAYKCQGIDGSWHITRDPPPEGTSYEKLSVRSDTNIIPGTRTTSN
ncbi:MAG: hypothetical protein ACI8PT_003202 [Gammaproteobacteria bacterium]|jgi:hypothetical protein